MNVRAMKSFSNLQNNYMFLVYIDNKAGIFEQGANFTITTKTTNILPKTRNKTDYKFLGRQISLPQNITHDGEWTTTVTMDQSGLVLKDFIKWFYLVDKVNLAAEDYKTNAIIQLVGLDGVTTNTAYALIGLYPTNVPGIEGLDQDGDGHITFDCTFGIDDIAHGTVDKNNNITWIEDDPNIYFPYKTIIKQLTKLPYKNDVEVFNS